MLTTIATHRQEISFETTVKSRNNMLLLLLTAVCISMPFLLIINRYVFVVGLTIIFLLIFSLKKNLETRIVLSLIISFVFSGISILGLRIYDWIILVSFLILFVKKGKLSYFLCVLPFLVAIIVVFLFQPNGESLLETIRYFLCIMIFVISSNCCRHFKKDNIDYELLIFASINIFYGLFLTYLFKNNYISNFNGSLFNTNFYLGTKEVRNNGFFSDPNKYMVFSFGLLFLSEIFVRNKKMRFLLIFACLFAAIISLSRTAFICVFLYFVLKSLFLTKKKSNSYFYLLLFIYILTIVLFLIIDSKYKIVDFIYTYSYRLTGRNWSASFGGSTLSDDKRLLIWSQSLSIALESLIFGHGWYSIESVLPYPSHNTFLALLVEGGLLALITFVVLFYPLIKFKRKDLVLSCIVIPSFFLDLQNYRFWFLLLGFVYIINRVENSNGTCHFN